jgi:N-acetyl-gamma-glutamyl-phosphate reductase
VRLLIEHPRVDLEFATTRSSVTELRAVDPAAPDVTLSHPDAVDPEAVDVVFLCLPHGASAPVAEHLSGGRCRIIDLSGDLRLVSPAEHARHYGTERSEQMMQQVVFGLPELHRAAIQEAQVVANPGCYATATILGLAPLAGAGLLQGPVCVDAKSGVSGAGREPTATTHYCSASEDTRPYKVGRVHRHVPEIEQELHRAGGTPTILFAPHLVPMERGILATCMVPEAGVDPAHARTLYQDFYRDEPFVQVLPDGEHARTRAAAHSNRAVLSLHTAEDTGWLIVASAIDNLGKGAAGQAIQNMNLLCQLTETAGLRG